VASASKGFETVSYVVASASKGLETVSSVVASTSKGFATVSHVVASASKGFETVSHVVASTSKGFETVSYVVASASKGCKNGYFPGSHRINDRRNMCAFALVALENGIFANPDMNGSVAGHTKKQDMLTIVKREDAGKKIFKGVSLDVLAIGEKSMVTKMNYVKGDFAATHAHANEQCGYVISGKYRLTVHTPDGKIDAELHAGDSYAIPENSPHAFEVLEGGEVVDVFTPPRKDYL
jgi:quercetin dioxygenase-like cupin family protein